jgi:membrane associated rhomboid family serine protease
MMAETPRFRARPATSGLIAVCTVLFAFTWTTAKVRGEEHAVVLDRMGALSAVRVWLDGEWWRVVSAGLLHGAWWHLLLNMVGLWAVGHWTEKLWGGWRQQELFWISSIGGCLASLAWAEASLVVGASAGIFGVAGALVIARAWGRPELREAAQPVSARWLGFLLVFWLVVGALLPLFGVRMLAQAGHLGGLVFGGLVGLAFALPRERRFLRASLWSVVIAGLVGLGVAAREPSWRPSYHALVGAEQLARGEFEPAAAHFDQALLASPDDAQLANAVAYSLAEAGVDLERAESLVRESLGAEPDNADYLDTLGWILCRQGRAEEGRATLEQAQAAASREIPEIQEHLDSCDAP